MASKSEIAKEALTLADEALRELELSEATLTSIALKASRIARIRGDFDMQNIFLYEVGGFPSEPGGVSKDVWRLADKAGRIYRKNKDGEVKNYAKLESIENLESRIESHRESLKRSAHAGERIQLSQKISDSSDLIGQRRAFIYKYLSDIYYELKYSIATEDSFSRIRLLVDNNIADLVPASLQKFSAIYDNLESENSEDWSNAVHSCRRVLQELADVLYPAREDAKIDVNGKEKVIKLGPDSYINRLVAYAEEHSNSERFQEIVGSHMKFLGERLDAVFKAAQKGSHSEIVTKMEADRYVVYTYMIVGDLMSLKQEVELQLTTA
ncbi:hypothetical protein [Shewanella sp. M-Br]|uniref:hypothetical protein n=1 Tax=Shewanella sp. M-Br TaxID=2495595 RepID=UPI002949E8FC|nr:hypothetical protein SMBr_20210 [Shewanella sp. M-Br]